MVSKDKDKFIFYINHYIDSDQFKQLYNPDWMEKDINNINTVARMFRLASIRTTNYKFEVVREKKRKKEEIEEKRKIKVMAAKYQRTRKRICLSSKEEENYESNTTDEMDPNQANNKYLLQFWKRIGGKLWIAQVVYLFIHQVKYKIHTSSIY